MVCLLPTGLEPATLSGPQFLPFGRATRQEKLYLAKLESLELFVKVTAHDLNGPLTGINLNLQACRKIARTQKMMKLLDAVQHDLSTATSLLEELKSLNRRETYRLQPMNLIQELNNFVLQTSANKSHAVTMRFASPQEVLLIAGDTMRLRRVWQNIFRNSADAADARQPFGPAELSISCRKQGSYARIQFSDNAGGIPKEHINRIFEPFYTSKGEKNRGLGLFIARKIITEHQGKVRIASRKPVTRITIDLPLAK